MTERFLVTGALGCVGAWTVKRLVDEAIPVWAYDLAAKPKRLELIMRQEQLARVNFLEGDITDSRFFDEKVSSLGITHVIHLAAFQVPFVKADPIQGLKVNAVGSAVVFETIRRHSDQIKGFVYASSTGVYGPPEHYPDGLLSHDSALSPMNLYGVHKQAVEGMAKIYWQDYGIPSVGLRPCVVYGPGRDQGMTSTPTKAMLAAAAGKSYQISFNDTVMYQYADDAAMAFIQASRAGLSGAEVYNLGGSSVSMNEVVRAISKVANESTGTITIADQKIGAPGHIDASALHDAIGPIDWTEFEDGVSKTIMQFRQGISAKKIDVDRILAT